MPEQKEPPRPHGDPLEEEVVNSRDENQAQSQSDAADDAAGPKRKKQYDQGAELVSRID